LYADLLFAVDFRSTAQRYFGFEFDSFAAWPLIVILAKGHDPRRSPIFPIEFDVSPDLNDVAAIFGAALVGQRQPCSSRPMAKPGLGSDFTHTFAAGRTVHIVGNARHDLPPEKPILKRWENTEKPRGR